MESKVKDQREHPAPNRPGSRPSGKQTEDEILVAELLGTLAFRVVVGEIIVPRIRDARRQLIKEALTDERRIELRARLDEYEYLFEALFSRTESGEVPPELQNLFT